MAPGMDLGTDLETALSLEKPEVAHQETDQVTEAAMKAEDAEVDQESTTQN